MSVIPKKYNFSIWCGNTLSVDVTFPFALTGMSARMQIRKELNSTEAVADLTVENGGLIIGGTEDKVLTIFSPASETADIAAGDYVYDLEVVDDENVNTYLYGVITFQREVTR